MARYCVEARHECRQLGQLQQKEAVKEQFARSQSLGVRVLIWVPSDDEPWLIRHIDCRYALIQHMGNK